jgi:hypothetical protein
MQTEMQRRLVVLEGVEGFEGGVTVWVEHW